MFQRIAKRSIHIVPRLTQLESFQSTGIKGLMSPEQFKVSWTDYQNYLLKNLSLRTVGTNYEPMSTFGVLMATSRVGMNSNIFHFASQAHNNHLFFEQLQHKPTQLDDTTGKYEVEMTHKFKELINKHFESFDNLKNNMLYAADTMNGQGWVFLVEKVDKSLAIVTCNNDGTPYTFYKNQSIDLNGAISIDDYKVLYENNLKLKSKLLRNDFDIPLLCINVWDYCYTLDYGVTGKADYLEKVFDNINWSVVNKRLFGNFS